MLNRAIGNLGVQLASKTLRLGGGSLGRFGPGGEVFLYQLFSWFFFCTSLFFSGVIASFARVYISSSAPQCERILTPGGRFLRSNLRGVEERCAKERCASAMGAPVRGDSRHVTCWCPVAARAQWWSLVAAQEECGRAAPTQMSAE